MMRYPKAEWLGNGRDYGLYDQAVDRYAVVLHTTETRTLPGYRDGDAAPHLTYHPLSDTWWQHTDLDHVAGALVGRSTAGGPTNHARALQVEIICYSNGTIADDVGGLWVGDLPGSALKAIGEFVRWCHDTYAVTLAWHPKPYPNATCAGVDSPCRMDWDTWLNGRDKWGVCDHAQVPGNDHWDAGAIDWVSIMEYAGGTVAGEIDERVAALEAKVERLQSANRRQFDRDVKMTERFRSLRDDLDELVARLEAGEV